MRGMKWTAIAIIWYICLIFMVNDNQERGLWIMGVFFATQALEFMEGIRDELRNNKR